MQVKNYARLLNNSLEKLIEQAGLLQPIIVLDQYLPEILHLERKALAGTTMLSKLSAQTSILPIKKR